MSNVNNHRILNMYGAEYYPFGRQAHTGSKSDSLYTFFTYIGKKQLRVESGDSVFYFAENEARVVSGPADVSSQFCATVVRGYRSPNKTSSLGGMTSLPFINGCSTRQIFSPERIGDPTLQLLYVPPYSSEQEHHLHSTARVAYVLDGKGMCTIGLKDKFHSQKISKGTTIVIHPMCPHHFETRSEGLLVAPLHVFSSAPGGQEFNHPMYNGSHILK